jgi:curved DNA-binding protein CbpA
LHAAHPDANPKPGAIVQFQDISAAHELLTDTIRRHKYDEQAKKRAQIDDYYFTMRITPSKRALVPLPEPQVMYLLAELYPDPRASNQQTKRESRLNLTLVLDHSNSMSGARLDKVKVAAHQIIDNLSPNDILSVVSFADRASTIIPATTVTDKPALKPASA